MLLLTGFVIWGPVMHTRKAQGLSTNTLVLIALGILILITSIVFYTQNVNNAKDTLGNCQNLGGTCQNSCSPRTYENSFGVCTVDEQICCVGNS
jgi:hypothetical protein